MHYGTQKSGFEKHKEVHHEPTKNRNNIYERVLNRAQVPKTRDRFIHNAFTQILAPAIAKPEAADRYNHDKLNIKDIKGTNTDTYGKYKRLEGRNYMDLNDIEKTKPRQLK